MSNALIKSEASFFCGGGAEESIAKEEKATWQGKNLLSVPGAIVYSKDVKDISQNDDAHCFSGDEEPVEMRPLNKRVVEGVQIGPLLKLMSGNPFSALFREASEFEMNGLLSEEIDEIVHPVDQSKGSFYQACSQKAYLVGKQSPFFDKMMQYYEFLNTFENSYLLPFYSKLFRLAEREKCTFLVELDQHYHSKAIKILSPHLDPAPGLCKLVPKHLYKQVDDVADGNIALPCDYLITWVREVNNPTLESDYMFLGLALKGLGNTVQSKDCDQTDVCRDVKSITGSLINYFSMLQDRRPSALSICLIPNKTGAGYVINQKTEYSLRISHKNKDTYDVQFFDSEQEDDVLFSKTLKLANRQEYTQRAQSDFDKAWLFLDSRKNKKILRFIMLHGYLPASLLLPRERSAVENPAVSTSSSDWGRKVLICRISEVPKQEEFDSFCKKKLSYASVSEEVNIDQDQEHPLKVSAK